MAIRARKGKESQVAAALVPFGLIEEHSDRLLILHRKAGVSAAKVAQGVAALRARRMLEFATAVLFDAESQTRQVLTDEITVRLKPGGTQRTLSALKASHDLRTTKRNAYEPTQYIVKLRDPIGTRTLDVARKLDKEAGVEFASPNFLTAFKR